MAQKTKKELVGIMNGYVITFLHESGKELEDVDNAGFMNKVMVAFYAGMVGILILEGYDHDLVEEAMDESCEYIKKNAFKSKK